MFQVDRETRDDKPEPIAALLRNQSLERSRHRGFDEFADR